MSKIKPREPTSALRAEGLHTFLGAYRCYRTECALIDRSWNEVTQERYESAIKNRIVPHLRNHDRTPIQDYTLADFLNVIETLRRVGQNGDPNNFKPYEEETLNQYLHIMKTVVKVASMREFFPNVFEEAVSNQQDADTKRLQRMKQLQLIPKSFTVSEEKKILQYIVNGLEKRGEYASLFLVACCGLRIGESCAVNFGSIKEMHSFPGHYYLRVPQSTAIHSNNLKIETKTPNGHRNIPLPQYAVTVLFALREKRLQAMKKHPEWNVSIDNMPIAYMGKRELVRCSADAVARQANKMFEDLGMRKQLAEITEYLQQDASVLEEEQVEVDEFALIEKQPVAYQLRRSFASHMAVLLNELQLKYVLGHALDDSQTQRSDFLDERELFAIKQKMDQRPLLNEISIPPSLTLKVNSTVQTDGYSQEFIVPPEASRVKLSVTANEPNDSIDVTVTLSKGTHIQEEFGIHGTPFPHHFPRTTNVLKAYHNAFQKEDPKNNP